MTTNKVYKSKWDIACEFMSHEKFIKHVEKHEFAEWEIYEEDCYGTLEKDLKIIKQVIILPYDAAKKIKSVYQDTYIVHVDVDMKTAAMHMIEQEEFLTPETLDKIAVRCRADDRVFRFFKDKDCDAVYSMKEFDEMKASADISYMHDNWRKEVSGYV